MDELFIPYASPIHLIFDQVSASRGDRPIFSHLSFKLSSGQIIWVRGANGIGKTTLLKLAAGLYRPHSGEIKWTQQNQPNTPSNMVGYQGHSNAQTQYFTVLEYVRFWKKLYKSNIELEGLFKQINLSDCQNLLIKYLSAGQKRRLSLLRLLISRRPLWVLDEPLSSLDKTGQELIDKLINLHIKNGGSLLLASHMPPKAIGQNPRQLILERDN